MIEDSFFRDAATIQSKRPHRNRTTSSESLSRIRCHNSCLARRSFDISSARVDTYIAFVVYKASHRLYWLRVDKDVLCWIIRYILKTIKEHFLQVRTTKKLQTQRFWRKCYPSSYRTPSSRSIDSFYDRLGMETSTCFFLKPFLDGESLDVAGKPVSQRHGRVSLIHANGARSSSMIGELWKFRVAIYTLESTLMTR